MPSSRCAPNTVCDTCGAPIYRYPAQLRKNRQKFCSHGCRNKAYPPATPKLYRPTGRPGIEQRFGTKFRLPLRLWLSEVKPWCKRQGLLFVTRAAGRANHRVVVFRDPSDALAFQRRWCEAAADREDR